MSKHTPGPWQIGEYRQILGGDGKVLSVSGVSLPCGRVPTDDVSYANARLISAAPDLLASLKQVRGKIAREIERGGGIFADAELRYIDEAIAKAESGAE